MSFWWPSSLLLDGEEMPFPQSKWNMSKWPLSGRKRTWAEQQSNRELEFLESQGLRVGVSVVQAADVTTQLKMKHWEWDPRNQKRTMEVASTVGVMVISGYKRQNLVTRQGDKGGLRGDDVRNVWEMEEEVTWDKHWWMGLRCSAELGPLDFKSHGKYGQDLSV